MATLMVDFITSLDGYGAADGWPGLWGMASAEYLGWLGEQPEHTALMGATTYQQMAGMAEADAAGFDELTRQSKVVFSSSLTEPLTWANTRLVNGDAVEAVRTMKQDSPVELRTLGASACPGRCSRRVWWISTGSSSSRWSPERPARTGSTTAIPTSGSTSCRAAPSKAACSCWSTCPRCSTVHRAPRDEQPG